LTAAVALLLALQCAALPARADAPPAGPGVARISLIQGDVGVRHDDAGETVAAVVNAPLLVGDYLSTGDAGSAAELQVDGATVIRAGYSTQLRFTKLDSGERVAQIAQGTVEERVFEGGSPIAVDTPSLTVRPQGPGAYRIGVADDGSSQITVRAGTVDILTPQGDQTVGAGHSVNASGDVDKPSIEVVEAIAKDDFDSFNADRDASAKTTLADDSLPPALATDDYSKYGQWQQDPAYGQVWAPNEPEGWTPYSNGQWAWEGGYGWTWVGYEPWGWGPYHYGRWFFSPVFGWCWYPPPPPPPGPPAVAVAVGAPVWAPALVGFVGFGGPGVAGVASIGWVPLAPREPFYPWYGWSGGVFAASTTVNVVNVSSVTYVNRVWGHQVPIDRWQAGNFAHPAPITGSDWQNAQAVRGAVPVAPTRANLRYSNKPVPASVAKAPLSRPRFAALTQPPKTMPFQQVRSALQTQTGASNDAWDRFDHSRGTTGTAGGTDGHVPGVYRSSGATGGVNGSTSPETPYHGNSGEPGSYHGSTAPGAYHGSTTAGQYHGNATPAPAHPGTQPHKQAKPPQKKDDATKKP
jgi:hypothetical protein